MLFYFCVHLRALSQCTLEWYRFKFYNLKQMALRQYLFKVIHLDNISLITQWRELLLKRLLSAFLLMAIVGWPVVYYYLSQSDYIFEDHPLIVNIALVSIVALAILRYVNQLPILLRKTGLVFVVFGLGVALSFDSLLPESSFYLVGLSSIIACVLIGNRCGIFVLVVSFLYITHPADE